MTVHNIKIKHNITMSDSDAIEFEPPPKSSFYIGHAVYVDGPLLVNQQYAFYKKPPMYRLPVAFTGPNFLNPTAQPDYTIIPDVTISEEKFVKFKSDILYPRLDYLNFLMDYLEDLNIYHGWGLPGFKRFTVDDPPTDEVVDPKGIDEFANLQLTNTDLQTLDLYGYGWHYTNMLGQIRTWLNSLATIYRHPNSKYIPHFSTPYSGEESFLNPSVPTRTFSYNYVRQKVHLYAVDGLPDPQIKAAMNVPANSEGLGEYGKYYKNSYVELFPLAMSKWQPESYPISASKQSILSGISQLPDPDNLSWQININVDPHNPAMDPRYATYFCLMQNTKGPTDTPTNISGPYYKSTLTPAAVMSAINTLGNGTVGDIIGPYYDPVTDTINSSCKLKFSTAPDYTPDDMASGRGRWICSVVGTPSYNFGYWTTIPMVPLESSQNELGSLVGDDDICGQNNPVFVPPTFNGSGDYAAYAVNELKEYTFNVGSRNGVNHYDRYIITGLPSVISIMYFYTDGMNIKQRFGVETSTSMAKVRVNWQDDILYDDPIDGGPHCLHYTLEQFFGPHMKDLVISVGTASGYINGQPSSGSLPSGTPNYSFNHGRNCKKRDLELLQDNTNEVEILRIDLRTMNYDLDLRQFLYPGSFNSVYWKKSKLYYGEYDVDFTPFFDQVGDIIYVKVWYDGVLGSFDSSKTWWDYRKFLYESTNFNHRPYELDASLGFENKQVHLQTPIYGQYQAGWDTQELGDYFKVQHGNGPLKFNIKVDHLGFAPAVWMPE